MHPQLLYTSRNTIPRFFNAGRFSPQFHAIDIHTGNSETGTFSNFQNYEKLKNGRHMFYPKSAMRNTTSDFHIYPEPWLE